MDSKSNSFNKEFNECVPNALMELNKNSNYVSDVLYMLILYEI